MNKMNVDDLIVKTVDIGHSIIAKKGSQQTTYAKDYLTRCWLTMSNDGFYDLFGFNWVPPIELQNKVRKTL